MRPRFLTMSDADRYAAWIALSPLRVREESAGFASPALPELEVQARWFAGEFGRKFFTVTGEKVEIVQYGVWNRESGPDFREAAVSINSAPPVRGCIELDPDVRDWERHGHAANPAYDNVVLHAFWSSGKTEFFTRTAAGRSVSQVRLDLTQLGHGPLASIPYAKSGRCMAPLAAMGISQAADLLGAAAHYRFQKKAHRIHQAAEAHGESEALYQLLAEALGYKSNKLPFLLLAQRLPLGELRGRRTEMEAVLFGVAGFLSAADLCGNQAQTRNYLRDLWECWWPRRTEFGNVGASSPAWKFGGMRPLNHPHRRLGALAEIARRWPRVRSALSSADPHAIEGCFATLSHRFWDCHYTLTSPPSRSKMALVGPERVSAIVANIVLPFALRNHPAAIEKLKALPSPGLNLRVKTAALRLFGAAAETVPLLKTAAGQQGLLQIYEDFCCQDLSDCIQCKLPEQLAQWK